ncbi:SixA phosphatase family protein [Granulicella arctica]|uniref:Phosphohistidine phosphatase n=1 Tax=Granulicella arctica TaxID=940613 RepID=A0A7Y9TV03_9BACT|nr:histidine phosphatase family protein [Granulicella arctica]NYF81298.1 phosphohistidine phosphatase [Granulicella arctica]
MNLFILRHASAGTKRANPLLDIKRPLDKDGKRHCLQLSQILNAMNINFDLIVSSPLKRSLQTASLIGTETGYEAPILLSNGLAPEAKFPDFQKLLDECQGRENVLVVGHNPNLQSFLGALLVPPSTRTSAQTRLRKGSIARLNMLRRPASLQWLLDPRTVRALYSTSTRSARRKTAKK